MALIEAGLIQQLEEDLEMKVTYDGTVHNYSELLPADDPDYRGMKRPKFASAVTKEVSQQVYNHAAAGKLVVTLGGDHSIAIGTISGTAKAIRERLGREIAVIWVDAHADINTPETSDSGNIHGMPVSFLTGLAKEDREDVFGWLKEEHRLSTKKLVYIGLRDIDRGEKKILKEHGIKAFSMHDVDRYVLLRCGMLRYVANSREGMGLERLWIWHLVGSGAIHRFICPLTSTRWIQSMRLARARLCVVV
jgi:arginase